LKVEDKERKAIVMLCLLKEEMEKRYKGEHIRNK
jgi:hypothetical protein